MSVDGRRVIAQLGLVAALLAPTAALACPACAGREDSSATPYLIGSMILLPFGVAATVIRVFKKVAREEEEGSRTGVKAP